MKKNEVVKLLAGLFVPRDEGLEGVCFASEYMNRESGDKYAVYQAVSDAMHDSGLSHTFSYSIASRAVDILAEVEDWGDDDAISEQVDSQVPIYTHELMTIYASDSWAVDEARREFGNEYDSDRIAALAWYSQIQQMTSAIKSGLEDLLDDDAE